ncbi:hypothetical protein M3557_14095, partial [Bhargavaea ginsengi]|uniref:hypothetical protein n=1 Tax=Bhargavaea ginsengi TaxID=426757 RepID=UPI0020405E1E
LPKGGAHLADAFCKKHKKQKQAEKKQLVFLRLLYFGDLLDSPSQHRLGPHRVSLITLRMVPVCTLLNGRLRF